MTVHLLRTLAFFIVYIGWHGVDKDTKKYADILVKRGYLIANKFGQYRYNGILYGG